MNAPLAPPRLMTAEEFLALPDDGVERWLIAGQLREKSPETPGMTYRNRTHSKVESNIVYFLEHWLRQQTPPRGEVYSGEAGCRIRQNPDTIVGIDVVYAGADLAALDSPDTTLLDGVPTLVVEILSPNDTVEQVEEKVADYLDAGVSLVWIVHPRFQTVTVHRPDSEPVLFNRHQDITAEPHLPGFKVRVADYFE